MRQSTLLAILAAAVASYLPCAHAALSTEQGKNLRLRFGREYDASLHRRKDTGNAFWAGLEKFAEVKAGHHGGGSTTGTSDGFSGGDDSGMSDMTRRSADDDDDGDKVEHRRRHLPADDDGEEAHRRRAFNDDDGDDDGDKFKPHRRHLPAGDDDEEAHRHRALSDEADDAVARLARRRVHTRRELDAIASKKMAFMRRRALNALD